MVPNTCHKHGCCKQEVPLLSVALSTTWVGVQVGLSHLKVPNTCPKHSWIFQANFNFPVGAILVLDLWIVATSEEPLVDFTSKLGFQVEVTLL